MVVIFTVTCKIELSFKKTTTTTVEIIFLKLEILDWIELSGMYILLLSTGGTTWESKMKATIATQINIHSLYW